VIYLCYAIQSFNLTKKFPKTKRYRDLLFHPFKQEKITVLKNINLQVKKGELFGLLGPNGAGKTTLIKILCTLILPNEGKVYINGLDVTKNPKKVRKLIGYVVADERSFYWRLTGRQNLAFFATLQNFNSIQRESRIQEVLRIVRLEDKADEMFMKYSTGMKQKLAIARGILTNPKILFMDEPTRSLDPLAAQELRSFIKEKIVKEQGKTVFLATHNLQEAEELCDRIAIIDQGEIKACGTREEIEKVLGVRQRYVVKLDSSNGIKGRLQRLITDNQFVLLSTELLKDGLLVEIESVNGKKNISGLIRDITMAGGRISACYPKENSLHEVFACSVKGEPRK
jgi:ABC-2 type transport system ATP-binding protein